MGTSKSSSGPSSGVPLLPSWTPKLEEPGSINPKEEVVVLNPKLNTPSKVSEPARFRAARGQLGRFAKTGNAENFRQGVGNYTRSGLGGKKQATKRFSATAKTAGILFSAISSVSNGQSSFPNLERRFLQEKSAEEIISRVSIAVRPPDGSQDAEASRSSVAEALSDLLEKYPEAQLLDMTEEHKLFVVEQFVANDVFRRLVLDVGGAIKDRAKTALDAAKRLKEVKEFVKETISAAFRKLRKEGVVLSETNAASICSKALSETFNVFEDYLK